MTSNKHREGLSGKVKVGSLCAGIGGFEYALDKEVYTVQYACDMDANASMAYRHNYPETPFHSGVISTIPDRMCEGVDIVTAGFPCQPFSIAGRRRGLDDIRSDAIFQIIDHCYKHKPKAVILENVKNLLSINDGEVWDTIIKSFSDKGYHLSDYRLLNTASYTGIPQYRERVFAVFHLGSPVGRIDWPDETYPKGIWEVLDTGVDERYYYKGDRRVTNALMDIAQEANPNTAYQWRRTYIRENKKGLVPTLTKSMGTGGDNIPIVFENRRPRKLTESECLRLQGFDDNFGWPDGISRQQKYMLIGNAVTAKLGAMVVEATAKTLKETIGNVNI